MLLKYNFPTSWCHLFCEVHQSLLQQTRGHFSRKYNLCPHVQLKTVVWLFYGGFGAVASSLLSGLSGYVDIGLVLLWIYILLYCFLQHLHKVLCCCSGIYLHFSHHGTFISRRQNVSPSWWRLRGPMVFILAYYCLYRWTRYLQAFGNGSQGWIKLVEVSNSEVLADLFLFSHDVNQSGTEYEDKPRNRSTGTPPIDSNDVN